MKKKIVISAINILDAGPLSILTECLDHLSQEIADKYEIIALVNRRDLVNIPRIAYYEFPESKKSWLKRLWYEYVYFNGLSKKLKPYLWLSLHDITPNVESEILATYCHHASPFYRVSLRELRLDCKFVLFHLFYKYLYGINIKRNDFVIVQQEYMRKKFEKIFCLNRVVVSHPTAKFEVSERGADSKAPMDKKTAYRFFYPSLPRVFKNFEVICEAARILSRDGNRAFEVYLTVSGQENSYSRGLYKKYRDIKNIKFIGLQTRERVFEYYGKADCMIFPSRLESWGVPITEFRDFKKPILLADMEYAHESIGDHDKVKFFNPDDHRQLSDIMRDAMENKLIFDKTHPLKIDPPFASNWKELFDILLEG